MICARPTCQLPAAEERITDKRARRFRFCEQHLAEDQDASEADGADSQYGEWVDEQVAAAEERAE